MSQLHYATHVAQLQQTWSEVLEDLDLTAVVVHSGSPILSFLDDYVYPFRPNPHFLAWLPLTHHPDCALILRAGHRPQLWYYQPDDYWHLPPGEPEPWWAEHFEIIVCTETDGWKTTVKKLGPRIAALGDSAGLRTAFPDTAINPEPLVMRLHLLRTRKSDYELGCMREATRLSVAAHLAAADAFLDGRSEYDIHLAYLATVWQADAELPYQSIVALNGHSAVLHYQGRDRLVPAELRSFLIDAGACMHGYAADITRTYAAQPGEFSDLIEAMERVEMHLAARAVAGQPYPELHLEAHRLIAGILKEAGIIRLAPDDAVSSSLSSVFFPHGLGHFIGLQTHDVAGLVDNHGHAIERPAGHPWLRLTRVLEPGNVLTIEPGMYFIPSLLSQWQQRGDKNAVDWAAVERLLPCGGIRIEDNVVVGEVTNENLTREAFLALG
jgi:Xaa-Pro dipeptidase